eukprot:CAMPEP_0114983218 /NCGR_PEP_ID=MMETSP0216-20121206/6571_1 /TAXON_ID=223996 /ORGANISM="Protocruzia adherens, Strain Boccale" /LENGTH=206 /DNA_ID=CAMNT_0002345163 /DNA_START=308 /DNA_END=924 /DNA_ORIENTATION=-
MMPLGLNDSPGGRSRSHTATSHLQARTFVDQKKTRNRFVLSKEGSRMSQFLMNNLKKSQLKLHYTNVEALFEAGEFHIDEKNFTTLFENLEHKRLTESETKRRHGALSEIFRTMDQDGNGTLDPEELINGLMVVCGGSQEDKLEAVFMLYDVDNSGTISFEEMYNFFKNVFKMLFSTKPELVEQLGVSYDILARSTAEHAFEEADT